MRIKGGAVAVALSLGAMLTGCGDTCTQLCDEAADFHGRCMDQWGATWQTLGYEGPDDYVATCVASKETAVQCVSDWCDEGNPDDPDASAECALNEKLGILRGCEADKEYYRQPCSDYWMSVYQYGDPMFDNDPSTCNEADEEETAG